MRELRSSGSVGGAAMRQMKATVVLPCLLLAIDDLPAEGLQMADHVQWRLSSINTKGRMTISTRCEN